MRFEESFMNALHLEPDVVVCSVDNNPTRVAVSRSFRTKGIPVVFTAVSRDADHGYVFIQDREGACLACLFPDILNDDRYPCPGTPAIADILQAAGAFAVYAIDTVLMRRPRSWNYRRIALSDGASDGCASIRARVGCPLHDS